MAQLGCVSYGWHQCRSERKRARETARERRGHSVILGVRLKHLSPLALARLQLPLQTDDITPFEGSTFPKTYALLQIDPADVLPPLNTVMQGGSGMTVWGTCLRHTQTSATSRILGFLKNCHSFLNL